MDITKAINVNEQFQVSRQFWAFAVDNGILTDPRTSSIPFLTSASSTAPTT